MILRLRGVAGHDRRPASPARSKSAASSVATTPSRRASAWTRRSAAARNACGVCASQRSPRGSVATIRPSCARFTVSGTGVARIAAPHPRAAATHAAIDDGRDQRPRGVVHDDDLTRRLERGRSPSAPNPDARRRRPRGAPAGRPRASNAAQRLELLDGAATTMTRVDLARPRTNRRDAPHHHRLAAEGRRTAWGRRRRSVARRRQRR